MPKKDNTCIIGIHYIIIQIGTFVLGDGKQNLVSMESKGAEDAIHTYAEMSISLRKIFATIQVCIDLLQIRKLLCIYPVIQLYFYTYIARNSEI